MTKQFKFKEGDRVVFLGTSNTRIPVGTIGTVVSVNIPHGIVDVKWDRLDKIIAVVEDLELVEAKKKDEPILKVGTRVRYLGNSETIQDLVRVGELGTIEYSGPRVVGVSWDEHTGGIFHNPSNVEAINFEKENDMSDTISKKKLWEAYTRYKVRDVSDAQAIGEFLESVDVTAPSRNIRITVEATIPEDMSPELVRDLIKLSMDEMTDIRNLNVEEI